MSDLFYTMVRLIGKHPFWLSSRPIVHDVHRTSVEGPCLLAANHHSPFDVPLLIRHVRRHIDFVSIVEVFEHRLVGWFYGSLNAFPLDRSRPDAKTMRIVYERLNQGRMVGMFPEGGLRPVERSMVNGGAVRPGIGRIATTTQTPILPCAILNSVAYTRVSSWLPLRRTTYGIAFGELIHPPARSDANADREAAAAMERAMCDAIRKMYDQLSADLALRAESSNARPANPRET